MLSQQILALTLIPLLAGVVPGGASRSIDLPALLGIDKPVSRSYLLGAWKFSEHFVKWGVTDKKPAKVARYRGDAFMELSEDGTIRMINLFLPELGRWEISDKGVIIYDPKHPERGSQMIPIRKRDRDRMWMLLPFAGGANGLGMERVDHAEFQEALKRPKKEPLRRFRGGRRGTGRGMSGFVDPGSGFQPQERLAPAPEDSLGDSMVD